MILVNAINLDGSPFDLCPRKNLKVACEKLHQLYGYEIKVGVELEFVLLKPSLTERSGYEPIETCSYSVQGPLMSLEDDWLQITHD